MTAQELKEILNDFETEGYDLDDVYLYIFKGNVENEVIDIEPIKPYSDLKTLKLYFS